MTTALPTAKEVVKELGIAAALVASRVAFWGALGAFLGALSFVALYASGTLDHPWPPWRYAVWALLPLDVVGGGLLFGHAGLVRGVGRVVLRIAVHRGLVPYVLAKVLDRVTDLVLSSDRLARVASSGEETLKNLPLARFETTLKTAVDAYVTSDDLEAEATGLRKRMLRRVKRFLCERIEKYLLTIVRAEETANGGGGISLPRVREVALAHATEAVAGAIVGVMNKNSLLATGVFAAGVTLPVVVVLATRNA